MLVLISPKSGLPDVEAWHIPLTRNMETSEPTYKQQGFIQGGGGGRGGGGKRGGGGGGGGKRGGGGGGGRGGGGGGEEGGGGGGKRGDFPPPFENFPPLLNQHKY